MLCMPLSMAALLPGNLQQYLEPYLLADSEPALQEVVLDQGRPVELRLSRGRPVQLPVACSVAEALQCLAAAKARADEEGSEEEWDEQAAVVQQPLASSGNAAASGSSLLQTQLSEASSISLLLPTDPGSRSASLLAAAAPASAGTLFSSDNRLALPGSLHRISAMRDPSGQVYGLTYRIGRHVPGAAAGIKDVLWQMAANHRCVRR